LLRYLKLWSFGSFVEYDQFWKFFSDVSFRSYGNNQKDDNYMVDNNDVWRINNIFGKESKRLKDSLNHLKKIVISKER